MAQIYLSSTYSDLVEHREVVYRTLRQMRHDVVAMEDYVAGHRRPLSQCLADVESCDIYVLIVAWRYGHVPRQDNPEGRSITELEFRHAVREGKTCLVFLLAEDYPWPPSKMERGEGGERVQALRAELCENFTVSFFRNAEDLARLVGAAIYQCQAPPPARAPRPAPAGVREPNLGHLVSKMCDRSRQTSEFMDFFMANLTARKGAPQVYFVHGEERECHDSLVERLTYTQIKGYAEKCWGEQRGVVVLKKLGWAYEGAAVEVQQELKRMLFAEFDPIYLGEDLSATALSQLAARSLAPIVVIQHRVYAARWNRAVRESLEWYIRYWADLTVHPSRPQFVIFLSLIYRKPQPGKWWQPWRTAAQPDKEQIARELREISESSQASCPRRLLRELLPLRREEVKDWLSTHRIHSEKTQYELLERIFKTGDGCAAEFISMAEVEHELEGLIKALSQGSASARGWR